MKKKLVSKRGMTLMELLCALVVLSLLGAAIALALPSTVRTFNKSASGSEASVLCSTLGEAVAEELRFASDIETNADGTLKTYSSQRFGPRVRLAFKKTEDGTHIAVEADDGKEYPLVSYKAYTSALSLNADGGASRIVYIPEKKLFYVALTVYNKQTDSNVWNEFYVRPLNPPENKD